MTPLKDRVIVKTERQTDYETASGLYVADDGAQNVVGRVISVGDVPDVAEGDVVIFPPSAGSPMEHEGESLLVLHGDDILAIVE